MADTTIGEPRLEEHIFPHQIVQKLTKRLENESEVVLRPIDDILVQIRCKQQSHGVVSQRTVREYRRSEKGFRILYLNRCGGSTPPSPIFRIALIFQCLAITHYGGSTGVVSFRRLRGVLLTVMKLAFVSKR